MRNKNEWIDCWKTNNTPWHREDINNYLLEFYPNLGAKHGQRILIPLCGKSKDMIWLAEKGLIVEGVEISTEALNQFKKENNFNPENLKLFNYCFFEHDKGNYDLCFDRGSFVALPRDIREKYVAKIDSCMKIGAKILLVSYDTDEIFLEGPPFSVSQKEIEKLYPNYSCELLKKEKTPTQSDRMKELGLEFIYQTVYLLTKLK